MLFRSNNLSETAFYVQEAAHAETTHAETTDPKGGHFHIRWFTPTIEVDLCGHATLATAHVLYNHKGFTGDTLKFASRSGELKVKKVGDLLTLDFPADTLTPIPVTDNMSHWFGKRPEEAYKGKTDYMLVFAHEADIADIQPNLAVTTLTPYWSKRLEKNVLIAQQLSARKGYLQCKNAGDRIEISGQAKTYLIGQLRLPTPYD